jgi:hypothetical protein
MTLDQLRNYSTALLVVRNSQFPITVVCCGARCEHFLSLMLSGGVQQPAAVRSHQFQHLSIHHPNTGHRTQHALYCHRFFLEQCLPPHL